MTQENIGVVVEPGVPAKVVTIPDGEKGQVACDCRRALQSVRPGRSCRADDAVVAVGGGVDSDVAGLAAALYHRGIDYVNVPTTLLAQVDAAIGGKTGVNLPEGKNLVGAFWQPSAVLCDTDTIGTLDDREIVSGHGEMANCTEVPRSAGKTRLSLGSWRACLVGRLWIGGE